MYGLPSHFWKELSPGRRAMARLGQRLPAKQRLLFWGLPSGVVSVDEGGDAVQEIVRRGDEGLYRVPQAWIWTRGAHLDRYARIVSEISPGVNRPPAWWFVRRRKFFPPVVELEGTIFSMIGDAAENLYHWTYDVLPRLRMLDPARRNEVRVLVRLIHPFHQACLEAAGFPASALIPAKSMTLYRAEELLAARITKGLTPDNILNAREIYGKAAGPVPEAKTPIRLYVSRGRATSRRITNEDALLKLIEPRGYRKVYLETLPLAEQLALFRDAESIIAPTGAALTHVHMCGPATRVLIIMPVGCDDYLCQDMANAAGIYSEMLDVPLAEAKADPVKADLVLDDACFRAIEKFIG